jgi:hypothetical protein
VPWLGDDGLQKEWCVGPREVVVFLAAMLNANVTLHYCAHQHNRTNYNTT